MNLSIYQLYSVLLRNSKHRDNLISYLTENGISSKVYFSPIHQTGYYKNFYPQTDDLKTTLDISKRIISIPIYPNLLMEDMQRVITTIKDFTRRL